MAVTDTPGNPGGPTQAAHPSGSASGDGSAPAIHAIIPAGGAGTRLWPLSRRRRPRDNLLAEPSPRDSMAAIGLAAAVIAHRHGRDAVVGSFAADHTVADRAAFADAVRQAARLAEQGWVVTIGIEATGPSTAFGYIHAGDPTDVPGAPDGRRVLGFTEKPDANTAAAYLATGDYRWNAGMFVVRAGVLLDHLAELRPQLAQGIEAIAAVWDAPEREEVLAERWPALEKIAIDHAIAEPVTPTGPSSPPPPDARWCSWECRAPSSSIRPTPSWSPPPSTPRTSRASSTPSRRPAERTCSSRTTVPGTVLSPRLLKRPRGRDSGYGWPPRRQWWVDGRGLTSRRCPWC